jgi:hypothetical protein
MNNGKKSLLREVLNLQSEPENAIDELDIAFRIRANLASGQEMDEELTKILWISPLARSIYVRLKIERLRNFLTVWRERGFSTEIHTLAAGSDNDEDSFVASGLQFHMVRNYATGKWVLTLQLTPDSIEELPPGISVRVSDEGGRVWLDGKLDRQGSLDGFWEDSESNPRQRASKFGLRIEFH